MRYQYVLWDFDGTLVDTSEGIYKSLRVAFAQMGLKLPSPEILQQFIGPPLNYSFQNFIGLPPEEALRATKCFRADYAQDGLFHSQVYPGMADILKELHAKGAGVGVATLKPEKMARLLLDRFGLMPLLGTCCGTSGDETASATKADIIRRALGELGCRDLSDAVLIGRKMLGSILFLRHMDSVPILKWNRKASA